MAKEFKSFAEFYSFYLSEHRHPTCRRLHFFGTSLSLFTLIYVLFTFRWVFLLLLPVFGYGCAWIGHFFFEKNRPATLKHPLYSFIGDLTMFKDILAGRIKL